MKITYPVYTLEKAKSSPIGVRFEETNIKNAETDPLTAPMVPRPARLKPEDFEGFGYTVGCPGCDQLRIGGSIRRHHNESWRDRIEAELMKTESGKDRLGKAKDRLDTKISEMDEEVGDGPKHPKDASVGEQQVQGEMPAASADMMDADEAMSVPVRGTRGTTEIYIGTPDRPRIDKRRSDPDEMEEDVNKVRKFNSEIEEGEEDMSIPGSPDNKPDTKSQKLHAEDDILDRMNEVDRKILAAAILGFHIIEVYFPERVAKWLRQFTFGRDHHSIS